MQTDSLKRKHWPRWLSRLVRAFAGKTGALDIHGNPIREGDEVLLYRQEYDSELLNVDAVKLGETPIYEINETRPHPVKDVPLARGVVEWDGKLLAYMVRYTWVCPQWSRGPGSAGGCCQMGGGRYAYELCPNNDSQTPGLLSKPAKE